MSEPIVVLLACVVALGGFVLFSGNFRRLPLKKKQKYLQSVSFGVAVILAAALTLLTYKQASAYALLLIWFLFLQLGYLMGKFLRLCNHCGAVQTAASFEAKFCSQCGAPLNEPKKP